MTINLFDIPAATSAYIDNEVDVEVTRVTANLEDGEEGTFTVRVTNASEPNGVRLTDIVLHVTVSPATVALLKPPGSALLFPRHGRHERSATVHERRSRGDVRVLRRIRRRHRAERHARRG